MRNRIIALIIAIVLVVAVLLIDIDNISHDFVVVNASTTSEYKKVSLDGLLISFPFKKYIISGTLTLDNDVFKLKSYRSLDLPENDILNHIEFKDQDYNTWVVGRVTIRGDVLSNINNAHIGITRTDPDTGSAHTKNLNLLKSTTNN